MGESGHPSEGNSNHEVVLLRLLYQTFVVMETFKCG